MHKYWSKKPYNIIRTFIKKYSQAGDIITDPFCGSGISVIEGIFSNRRAIGIDINPSAIFITRQVIRKADTDKILSEFEKLKDNVKNKIDSLYEIRRSGDIYYGTHFIWENERLTEIWSSEGNRKKIFEPIQEDEEKAVNFKIKDIPFFYPKNNFYHNSRLNTKNGQRTCDLFTPRNLYALSMLYNEIEQIEDEKTKDIFKFVFTSSSGQSSKMVFIVKKRGKNNGNIVENKKEVGSWVIGYWTPGEYFEINVWKNFESRFDKIIKAKKPQFYADYKLSECETVAEILNHKCNLCLINEPAQKILADIPDDTVDYVITDPPHGDRIPYLELSMLWNSWLKSKVNYEDEIVISNARERGKDINDYNRLMNKVYSEIYRILKPDKYFSLIFNSLDDETWTNLILYLNKLGFYLCSVETLGYSANSVVQDNRKKGLKTDFVLTFQKKRAFSDTIEILNLEKNGDYLNTEIKKITENRNKIEVYEIINAAFQTFLSKNQFFRLSDIIKIINKN